MSTFSQLKTSIEPGLYRYEYEMDIKTFDRLLCKYEEFLMTKSYRWAPYIIIGNVRPLVFLFKLYCKFLQLLLTVDLPLKTRLRPCIFFAHLPGSVFHENAVIGNNLHIAHKVTIGATSKSCPVIGNNVVILPSARIFGKITNGENMVIGTNAVVSIDVPKNAIMAGVPAHGLAFIGSTDYTFNLPHDH